MGLIFSHILKGVVMARSLVKKAVLLDFLIQFLRIDLLASKYKIRSGWRQGDFIDPGRVKREMGNGNSLISAVSEILRPGFILFGFSFQHAEDDQLPVSLVGFFREAINADFLEAVGEHSRNLAVQSLLRDEIDQNPFGTQIGDAVPKKGPFVPFGFFDITIPSGPVIGRIEPKEAECPVTDPGILVIGDKAPGQDLFGLFPRFEINLDPVMSRLKALSNILHGGSHPRAGIQDTDQAFPLSFEIFGDDGRYIFRGRVVPHLRLCC